MRNNYLKVFVFILFFNLFIPRLNAESELPFYDSDATISLDFEDVSLKNVLKALSKQSGLNFIASEAVQDRKITMYLDKVPLKETMEKLFKANNLSYDFDEESTIFVVKEWGKPEIETLTKVFYLKHHPVSTSNIKNELASELGKKGGDIKATLEGGNILSTIGKITEDTNTNSLIITDVPSRFKAIEEVIAKLDISVSQVLIDVEMLDVSKGTVDKLGFDLGDNPLTLILPGGFAKRGADMYFGAKANRNKEGGLTLGSTYANVLDFLRTQIDTKYLARPRLLTLNNETAEINITKNEVTEATPKISSRTISGGGTEEYISGYSFVREKIGISLRVTPQINLETNEVTMVIKPSASASFVSPLVESLPEMTVGSTSVGSAAREAETKTTKSIVKVKDGETVILGGLIHTDRQVTQKKVPLLGDIPFLGALFRSKNVTADLERELLVFITPHIVRDTGMGYAQSKKITIPEREQDMGQIVSRKTAISTSLDSFERVN
jgi:type IV pilus assembly protein PilQ